MDMIFLVIPNLLNFGVTAPKRPRRLTANLGHNSSNTAEWVDLKILNRSTKWADIIGPYSLTGLITINMPPLTNHMHDELASITPILLVLVA